MTGRKIPCFPSQLLAFRQHNLRQTHAALSQVSMTSFKGLDGRGKLRVAAAQVVDVESCLFKDVLGPSDLPELK